MAYISVLVHTPEFFSAGEHGNIEYFIETDLIHSGVVAFKNRKLKSCPMISAAI